MYFFIYVIGFGGYTIFVEDVLIAFVKFVATGIVVFALIGATNPPYYKT